MTDGGPAVGARLRTPFAVSQTQGGGFLIADTFNSRIRKVTPAGIISTVVGNGIMDLGGDGGPAAAAELNHPGGVAVDAAGNLYIADSGNLRIRKVTPAGIITTVASR